MSDKILRPLPFALHSPPPLCHQYPQYFCTTDLGDPSDSSVGKCQPHGGLSGEMLMR